MMAKLFGANWKTTVTGGLQAVISAIAMGTLTFPSDWKNPQQVALFLLVLLGTFFGVKFAMTAKDKEVTGGITQQTVSGEVADPGTQTLVDETVKASIKSGDLKVTPEQKEAVRT